MAKITRAMIMKMDEATFKVEANSTPEKHEWLVEAVTRLEPRETYPRVKTWNVEKGKYTYKANKDAEPKIDYVAISFFSLKSAYCDEVLKLPKKEPETKVTFRNRLLEI